MLSKSTIMTVAGAVTLAAAHIDPDLNRPEMSPGFNRDGMNQGFLDHIQPVGWGYYHIPGKLPQICVDEAKGHNLNLGDMEAFGIRTDDCNIDWTWCRHKDGASIAEMGHYFAHVPVKMRQFVRQFIGLPDHLPNNFAAAYTYAGTGDVVLFGSPSVSELIHEFSHILDMKARRDLLGGADVLSNTNLWKDKYYRDANTVTLYARTSFQEDFAESGMIGIYDKSVPGGFPSLTAPEQWRNVYNQYATWNYYFDQFGHYGGSCEHRAQDSPFVNVGRRSVARTGSITDGVRVVANEANLLAHNITILQPIEGVAPIICNAGRK